MHPSFLYDLKSINWTKLLITEEYLKEIDLIPSIMHEELLILFYRGYSFESLHLIPELLFNKKKEIFDLIDLPIFIEIFLRINEPIKFKTKSYNLSRRANWNFISLEEIKSGTYVCMETKSEIYILQRGRLPRQEGLYTEHQSFIDEMYRLRQCIEGDRNLIPFLLTSSNPYIREICKQKVKEATE